MTDNPAPVVELTIGQASWAELLKSMQIGIVLTLKAPGTFRVHLVNRGPEGWVFRATQIDGGA